MTSPYYADESVTSAPTYGRHAQMPEECKAGPRTDGECFWPCPQLRDGEPEQSGRSCPITAPWDD